VTDVPFIPGSDPAIVQAKIEAKMTQVNQMIANAEQGENEARFIASESKAPRGVKKLFRFFSRRK